MKMKKLNWKHLSLLIILVICIGIVLHDIYLIGVACWISSKLYGFTFFGFITFVVAIIVGVVVWEKIKEKLK